jgi:hypothetical protein
MQQVFLFLSVIGFFSVVSFYLCRFGLVEHDQGFNLDSCYRECFSTQLVPLWSSFFP